MLFILFNNKSKKVPIQTACHTPHYRQFQSGSQPHPNNHTRFGLDPNPKAQFLCFSSTNPSTNLSSIKASICKHKRTQKKKGRIHQQKTQQAADNFNTSKYRHSHNLQNQIRTNHSQQQTKHHNPIS